MMLRWRMAVVLVGWVFVAQAGSTQDAKVTLRTVNYEGLKEAITKNRGKVVLVDFWGDFCVPCKKGFPHLVDLQKQFGDKGLTIITVALDSYLPNTDAGTRQRVLDFLQAKGSSGFINLYLEDPSVKWEEKFRFTGPPAYYVFSRQGKWTMFKAEGTEPVDTKAMDKLIVDLLQEK